MISQNSTKFRKMWPRSGKRQRRKAFIHPGNLSSPLWKSAPLPSRLGNVLKLLTRERKLPVFPTSTTGC